MAHGRHSDDLCTSDDEICCKRSFLLERERENALEFLQPADSRVPLLRPLRSVVDRKAPFFSAHSKTKKNRPIRETLERKSTQEKWFEWKERRAQRPCFLWL